MSFARFLSNFYTTGYTGKSVEQLPALLDFHDAVLADIRFAPHSRHLQWTKNYLSLMLKDRYRHVAALGNRNYKTPDSIQIHNLEIGIRLIQSWETNVILMCACENRKIVIAASSKTSLKTRLRCFGNNELGCFSAPIVQLNLHQVISMW